jgi:2'-5' RNA ligase
MESKNYQWGCVMVEVEIKNWQEILNKIDDSDLYMPEDEHHGKQKEPHITILYGIDTSVSDDDIKNIFQNVRKEDFNIQVLDINLFENENYDVLKIEVEDKLLNEYFNQLKKLPNHSDYPEYNAHVTIAYLKSGLGKKYVEKNPDINLKVKSLVYSKPNGERINLVK